MNLRRSLADDVSLKMLRESLDGVGYVEHRVAERLGLWHVAGIAPPEYPMYAARLERHDDALSLCVSLFLLQGEVSRPALDELLGAQCVSGLIALGLLFRIGARRLAAAASVYPCAGGYFVTDHAFRPVQRAARPAPAQPVMHLGQDSYALAYLGLEPGRRGRVLDLCAGSGVHGILAGRRARNATLVDVNPRAADFARLNAALNDAASHCDVRCGSLYDVLDADERFELVLANPPFVPSPSASRERLLFRDGGATGDAVLAPVLRTLCSRLTPSGVGVVISLFAERKRACHETLIRKLVGARSRASCLFLRIRDVAPEELAFGMAWRPFEGDFASHVARHRRWGDAIAAAKVENLVFGILIVRPAPLFSFDTLDFPLARALSGHALGDLDGLGSTRAI